MKIGIAERIFGFIWAIWCGFAFVSVMAIATFFIAIFLLVFGKSKANKCLMFSYNYLGPLFQFLFGVKNEIVNIELINPNQNYIVIANHSAQLDIICGSSALPIPAKFLAKSEILKVPFFGFFVKMLAIPVNRKDKNSREQSVTLMTELLKSGESVYIYPEGTRNRVVNGPLKEFKDGAFRIAIDSGVPIAIQVIENTGRLNNPNFLHLIPGKVKTTWLKPIETKHLKPTDIEQLKLEVRGKFQEILNPVK